MTGAVRKLIIAVAAALLGAPPGPARAQLGAAAPAAGAFPGHGWVVIPADTDGYTLWHVPPRASSAGPDGAVRRGASSGTLRIVSRLVEAPEALAAWGGHVWLISAPRPGPPGEGPLRRIYRVDVRRSPIGPGWHYGDGARLLSEPPLAQRGALISAAGASSGLHILLQTDAGQRELWRLADGHWIHVRPPPDDRLARRDARAGLVAIARGVGLWIDAGAGTGPALWTSLPASSIDDATPVAVDWRARQLGAAPDLRDSAQLWSVGGRIISTEWLGGASLRVRDLSGDPPLEIALVDGLDPGAALCAMDPSRRIVAIWRDPDSEAPAAPWNPRRILEISTDDGSAFYDGLAQSPGPVSPAEFKLLAIALLAVSAAALVFIIRSDDGARAIELPPGAALAPAHLRILAGAIDLSIVWLAAAGGFGLAPEDWLAIAPAGLRLDFAPLLWTIAAGWAMGSVCEWLLGRTPGKWLAGCAVVTVRPADKEARRLAPRLWQAMIRNAVKYPLAPIALLGLASPTLRHRGDSLAGTAVIIHLTPEAPGE
ncbi:MAG: RDD family protein [Phycisphaerales bacterium JB039]